MDVVCGVIKNHHKYLIAKRGKGVDEGFWEFPGGKVETGETKEAALTRELQEELDITVSIKSYLMTIEDHHSDEVIYVSAFLCSIVSGNPNLHVHDEIRWVEASELSEYNFQKDDAPLIKLLQNS